MKKAIILPLLIFLTGYYLVFYWTFVKPAQSVSSYPILRDRLGTILWHSDGASGEEHLYCYYPKRSNFSNLVKEGDLIKKAGSLNDCNGYFGKAVFKEAPWVSELQKIWIYPGQDKLAQTKALPPI